MSKQSELMEALDELHKICPLVKASKENPYFKSKYADYNVIVTETREPLESSGLRIKQTVSSINESTAIRTRLVHLASGEFIEDLMPVVHKPNDPQAQGSGITYAKRYSYVAMLDLLVDQDDDGELSDKLTEASKKSEQIDLIIDTMKLSEDLGQLKKIFAGAGSLMKDKRIIRAKNARKAELENASNFASWRGLVYYYGSYAYIIFAISISPVCTTLFCGSPRSEAHHSRGNNWQDER